MGKETVGWYDRWRRGMDKQLDEQHCRFFYTGLNIVSFFIVVFIIYNSNKKCYT